MPQYLIDKFKNLKRLWYLTPLSTIFQLYCRVQFYWWRKSEYSEKTNDMSQVTNKPHRIIVVSSTRAMSRIQTHNVGGDCSCSCKPKPPYDHDHDSPVKEYHIKNICVIEFLTYYINYPCCCHILFDFSVCYFSGKIPLLVSHFMRVKHLTFG